jgi:pectate lyase
MWEITEARRAEFWEKTNILCGNNQHPVLDVTASDGSAYIVRESNTIIACYSHFLSTKNWASIVRIKDGENSYINPVLM